MEPLSPQQRPRLPIGGIIRRYLTIVTLFTVILGVAAAEYAARRTPTYVAAVKVQLKPILGNPLSPATLSNGQLVTVAMETEAGVATSAGVTTLAEGLLHGHVERGAVAANVPANTQIIRLQYTAPTRAAAKAGANAFAQAYLDYRAEQSKNSSEHQLESLNDQVKVAEKGLARATATLARGGVGNRPDPDAQAQVQLYSTRLSALADSIGDLTSVDNNPGVIIAPADSTGASSGPLTIAIVMAGVLAGLLLGALIAFWYDRRDDRLRANEQPLIGGVKLLGQVVTTGSRDSVGALSHGRPNDERTVISYRSVRMAVISGASPPSVIVVSGLESEAAAVVAVNLALTLRQAGHRTTLLDATLTGTGAAELFGMPAAPGLSDLLLGTGLLPNPLPEARGVRIIPRGSNPMATRDLYLSDRAAEIMDQLRATAHFVVVAAPPILTSDGEAVALAADHMVLVVTDRRTRHADVHRAVARLGGLGVGVLGAVSVPRPDRSRGVRRKAAQPGQGEPELAPPAAAEAPATAHKQVEPPEGAAAATRPIPAATGSTADNGAKLEIAGTKPGDGA